MCLVWGNSHPKAPFYQAQYISTFGCKGWWHQAISSTTESCVLANQLRASQLLCNMLFLDSFPFHWIFFKVIFIPQTSLWAEEGGQVPPNEAALWGHRGWSGLVAGWSDEIGSCNKRFGNYKGCEWLYDLQPHLSVAGKLGQGMSECLNFTWKISVVLPGLSEWNKLNHWSVRVWLGMTFIVGSFGSGEGSFRAEHRRKRQGGVGFFGFFPFFQLVEDTPILKNLLTWISSIRMTWDLYTPKQSKAIEHR